MKFLDNTEPAEGNSSTALHHADLSRKLWLTYGRGSTCRPRQKELPGLLPVELKTALLVLGKNPLLTFSQKHFKVWHRSQVTDFKNPLSMNFNFSNLADYMTTFPASSSKLPGFHKTRLLKGVFFFTIFPKKIVLMAYLSLPPWPYSDKISPALSLSKYQVL